MTGVEDIVKKGAIAVESLNDWELVNTSNCKKDGQEAWTSSSDEDNEAGTDNDAKTLAKEKTISLSIMNISRLDKVIYSCPIKVNGMKWQLKIMPHCFSDKNGAQKCLGLFLKCSANKGLEKWSCCASAKLCILSKNSEISNFSRMTFHTYTNLEEDWGYPYIMNWNDLMDESKGYIKDDTVDFEAVITANPPQFDV